MRQTEISDRGLVRLLSATYHKPPALRGLVDTEDELKILAEIEGLTSGRLQAERGRNPHIDPRELAWQRRSRDLRIYGDSHVNAAFTYTRRGGNRFNSEERGAWYCAWNVMVSVSEVAWHRTRELGYTGCYEDSARYVELLADFIGDFPDLHGEAHPALDPVPERGYPAGQRIAADLRAEGHRGLIYPSVRHPGGRCFVAFDPGIIQNVRPGASWKLVWQGAPEFTVEGL